MIEALEPLIGEEVETVAADRLFLLLLLGGMLALFIRFLTSASAGRCRIGTSLRGFPPDPS